MLEKWWTRPILKFLEQIWYDDHYSSTRSSTKGGTTSPSSCPPAPPALWRPSRRAFHPCAVFARRHYHQCAGSWKKSAGRAGDLKVSCCEGNIKARRLCARPVKKSTRARRQQYHTVRLRPANKTLTFCWARRGGISERICSFSSKHGQLSQLSTAVIICSRFCRWCGDAYWAISKSNEQWPIQSCRVRKLYCLYLPLLVADALNNEHMLSKWAAKILLRRCTGQLCIHNSVTTQHDLQWSNGKDSAADAAQYWLLCPASRNWGTMSQRIYMRIPHQTTSMQPAKYPQPGAR